MVVPLTELTDPLTAVSLTACQQLPVADGGALTVTAFAGGGGAPSLAAARDIETQIPF
jgi:hypothetical protein